MKRILAMLALSATPALADNARLTGSEIEALLTTITAHGTAKETRQKFWTDGRTEYEERGHYSYGRWWVDGDKYCSVWPPSEGVSCYAVHRNGDLLTWIGRVGDPIVDRIVPRQTPKGDSQ
ncbi:MAG: hypothetical protein AAGH68_07715 [Pseudomonadota bacterium]